MSKHKKVKSIPNWQIFDVPSVTINLLLFVSDNEEVYYNSAITFQLEQGKRKKKPEMAITLLTSKFGDCKFCVAREIAEQIFDIFGVVGFDFMVYDGNTRKYINSFSMEDVIEHSTDEFGNIPTELEPFSLHHNPTLH